MNEDNLWDMSDDELEAAFKEAQAAQDSPETEMEAEALPEPDFEESEPSVEEDTDEEVSLDEDTEEEIDDGPEQPEDEDLEDSGHDTSDESETDDATEEDGEAPDSDDLDEDSDVDDEPSSDEADEDDEEEQPVQSYKFRANGKDYEFSSEEIVDQFPKIFGQAMDYTKKMQTIKPWRKTIDAIEGAELNHDDVSLMIDVLKGDKDAITEVLKRTGTDTLELDTETESKYVAKDYGRDDSALAIKDIVDDISQDVEYATTHNVLSKQWDEGSWNVMAQNPEMIRLLHTDVKSGMYDTLQPIAEKLKVYDGAKKSDLDYYKEAAQQHFAQTAEQEAYEERMAEKQAKREAAEAEKARLAEVKAKSQKRTATKQASVKRKAAAPTKSAASRDVIDYLDDSDEAFDDWYKRLQDDM
jgi:hypothetical protein